MLKRVVSIVIGISAILLSLSIVLLFRSGIGREQLHLLIVGDSIGAGAGASDPSLKWYKYLIPYMEDTYDVSLDITNVSLGGNTSYAGYVSVMNLEEENYDFVIICYGQNDADEDFGLYYESILRAVCSRYPDCGLITILESSQRDYTEKMKTIQSLSDHYKACVADTIAAFRDSGIPYEELCDDGTHPNDAGQKVYYETVRKLVDDLYLHREQGMRQGITPVDHRVEKYDEFRYYPVEDFHKTDEYTYELAMAVPTCMLGIDYTTVQGDNMISVYADGEKIWNKQINWQNGFVHRMIEKVADGYTAKNVQVVFSSKEQMDSFHGLIASCME